MKKLYDLPPSGPPQAILCSWHLPGTAIGQSPGRNDLHCMQPVPRTTASTANIMTRDTV